MSTSKLAMFYIPCLRRAFKRGQTISAAVPQNEYTVREDGFVYTPDGKKTAYYLPQFHSPEYAYQTMGDMYYCVGEPDYKTTPPPLLPEYKPGTERDIYVGNIYLSENKPSFSLNEPIPVTKKKNGGIVETSRRLCALPLQQIFSF